jgi:CubicO group peptidase (beta-lactamase class C family)
VAGEAVTTRYFARRASQALWCSCILLTALVITSCALAQQATGALTQPVSPAPIQDWSIPSDDELRAFLAKRMEHNGVGIVIGVIEPAGRRVVAYGRSGIPDARALDGDTIFLIGSVSKTFVGLVLADMVDRGEVKLDDPASKFLPPGVKMPQRGRPITLADLSTHTSGLPVWPTNINMLAEPDPIEAYTVQDLYRFLSTYWAGSSAACAGTRFSITTAGSRVIEALSHSIQSAASALSCSRIQDGTNHCPHGAAIC